MTWIADAVFYFGWDFVWTYLIVVGMIAVSVTTMALSVLGLGIETLRLRLHR